MAPKFLHVSFHVSEASDDQLRAAEVGPGRASLLGMRPAAEEEPPAFHNDEAAARFFLDRVIGADRRPGLRAVLAAERPEVVPELQLSRIQNSPLTGTRVVSFDQVRTSIPIFGTRASVEIDEKTRQLVGITAELADLPDVSVVAVLTPADALRRIAQATGKDLDLAAMEPPKLTFFQREEDDSWHLAYLFAKVPAAPPGFDASTEGGSHGHGLGASPRELDPRVNYLVDAHDGEILFYYSATPLVSPLSSAGPAASPLPTKCKGIDEDGVAREFFGHQIQGAGGLVGSREDDPGGPFELWDPLRSIKTYDLSLGDISGKSFPADVIQHAAFDWAESAKAAVSAHVNAMCVYDFYKDVLKRDGIDDRGMDLVSVVNCTYRHDQSPPEWTNAVWWNNRMWYGQKKNSAGSLVSYSRYLDVIGHELTHGVTEHSSNLVYKQESGALNESFSDIFGIIIKNWTRVGPDTDPGKWSWEIGEGLGEAGGPLRDLSNPGRTHQPAHMKDYLSTSRDEGGVHANSNIHNKAAYSLFIAVDAEGHRMFPSRELAILYYLTLTRLSSLATFRSTLQMLLDVARTFYPEAVERQRKLRAIRDAYGAAGIVLEA